MSRVSDLLKVLSQGFLPYTGQVGGEVYENLGCPDKQRKPEWFVREGLFLCLGCSRRCVPTGTTGFELLLPVSYNKRLKAAFAYLPLASAHQLLTMKVLLRIDEAAWALNVSPQQVRNYVDEGRLEAHPDPPMRVTTKSVRRELERIK